MPSIGTTLICTPHYNEHLVKPCLGMYGMVDIGSIPSSHVEAVNHKGKTVSLTSNQGSLGKSSSTNETLCRQKKRIERELEVGDAVYLKLQPYRQTSVAVRKCFQLSSRYYGP